jgi:hypothetical protein
LRFSSNSLLHSHSSCHSSFSGVFRFDQSLYHIHPEPSHLPKGHLSEGTVIF